MAGVEAEIKRLEDDLDKDISVRNELVEGLETAYEEMVAAQDLDLQPLPQMPLILETGKLTAPTEEDDWDDIVNM